MSLPAKIRIRRFTGPQRLFHLALMICFLVQGASGLARMFIETGWGRTLAGIFGGYDKARDVHIAVGIVMICGFAVHALYVLCRIDWGRLPTSLFGPDSLVPQVKDIKEFFQHLGWLLYFRKPPAFDRWGYWEKFDYWAVFWGMTIIGATGLIMAYPLVSTRHFPGWGLNVAFWVHRIEALLAMAHIFIIHFFVGHLRPHNFPMDRSMFEGSADLAATRHERPDWIARLEKSGLLEDALVAEARPGIKTVYYLFGYAAMLVGVILLVGALANAGRITW